MGRKEKGIEGLGWRVSKQKEDIKKGEEEKKDEKIHMYM